MKKDSVVWLLLVVAAGVLLGLLCGSLFTWFPIRWLFCAYYNAPDCEEIVLITFPFYCIITPLLGGVIAFWLYRKRRSEAKGEGSVTQE